MEWIEAHPEVEVHSAEYQRHTEGVRRLTGLVACESCSLAACQYRRRPLAAEEYAEETRKS